MKKVLAEPGVRLLAVEFWAPWCKPCVRALPTWKKIHEKYRGRGLRLVMISVGTQDRANRCSFPMDWVPDHMVCDVSRDISRKWHATALPQAFLWSWQGNLLVQHGTAAEVTIAIERYFKNSPRILVRPPVDGNDVEIPGGETLRRLIRSEMGRAAKIELVATETERADLKNLKAIGYRLSYDEKGQCKLGMEVSANTLLKPTWYSDNGKDYLLLELFSLERGCMVGSGQAMVEDGLAGLRRTVKRAVAELVDNSLRHVALPNSDQNDRGPVVEDLAEEATADPTAQPDPTPTETNTSSTPGEPVEEPAETPEFTDTTPPPPTKPEPPTGKSKSITRRWWFWPAMGVVAVAAGYGAYSLLKPTEETVIGYDATINW